MRELPKRSVFCHALSHKAPKNVFKTSFISNSYPKAKQSFIHAYELVLGLHIFRQTGPPRRVDCLAPPSVCHIKTEASG